jgi:hypothetical protein
MYRLLTVLPCPVDQKIKDFRYGILTRKKMPAFDAPLISVTPPLPGERMSTKPFTNASYCQQIKGVQKMSENQLIQGEQVVMSSSDNSLCLTNLRVKYEAAAGGAKAYKSMPLRKISCCRVDTKHTPALLIVAGIAMIGAIASPTDPARATAVAAAIGLVILYFFSRRGQLEIVSDSGAAISVPTKGMKHEDVRRFAEAVAATIANAGV